MNMGRILPVSMKLIGFDEARPGQVAPQRYVECLGDSSRPQR
jgi:hypothetical protein